MPAEIELFNCSLCSFCETSLDRLASHIRQHIKPEPLDNIKDQSNIVTPRVHINGSINDFSHRQLNGHILATSGKKDEVQSKGDVNVLSPCIEVINPRTVTTSDSSSYVLSIDQQRTSVTHIKPSSIPPPPPLLEKSPQVSPYAHGYGAQPPLRYGTSNHHPQVRHDSATQGGRYIPIHPREQPFLEMNKSNRPYNPQFASPTLFNNKPFAPSELVTASQAKANNGYHDVQIIPTDVNSSVDSFRRSGERVIHKGISSPFVPTINQRGDCRMGPVQQIQHGNLYYHQRPPKPHEDNKYRNSAQTVLAQSTHQMQQSQLSPNHGVRSSSSHLQSQQISQVQSHLVGMQFPDSIIHQKTLANIPIGVPNRGTVLLNPEHLLSVTGNPSLDQLAGLLVIPLKKTSEMSTQTDPVEFVTKKENVASCSVQTDLRMRQVSEIHSKSSAPIFSNFRSTDALFECLVCGEELASDHHLQEHMAERHTHVCEKCYYSSTNINDHNNHVLECGHVTAEMLCIECNSSFTSLKKLNQHRSKAHNVRMPFRCGICNVPFECHEAVMKHIATHDNDVPEFKCRYCVKLFQSPEALTKHFIRHKGVEVVHECRFCKKPFNTTSLLQDHISYVHVISENDCDTNSDMMYAEAVVSRPTGNQSNTYASTKKHPCCRFCDLAFKNRDMLKRHVDICSKNNAAKSSPFICDVCKEYFPNDVQRRQHIKQEHRRANGYRCPKCSKVYRTWSRLKFHTKQQHVKKACPDCAMIFTKEHILRKHQEDVHGKPQGQPGERVYTCSLCNTMLNTLTELMNHRRDVHPGLSHMKTADQSSSATMLSVIDSNGHSNDTSKICPECGDKFISNKTLTAHMRNKHSSKVPGKQLQCDKCELVFEDEKRRKNHLGLVHGDKPFECRLCDKKFQYSSQVVWHMRSHRKKDTDYFKTSAKLWKSTNAKFNSIRKKPKGLIPSSYFVCQFCGAKFRQEKLLKNHKGAVHKIKLFSCDLCNVKFGHSTELIWHLRTCRSKYKRKHPGVEFPTPEKKKVEDDMEDYMCHICESTFKRVEDYQEHMTSHADTEVSVSNNSNSPQQNTKCDICDQMFSSFSAFKKHRKELHAGDNMILDEQPKEDNASPRRRSPSSSSHVMDTSIESKELLKHEPELDTVIGEYSCPICQKTTRSVTGMKTHYGRVHGVWGKESTHKDEEGQEVVIWPCKHCDEEFTDYESLRDHTTDTHGLTVMKNEVDVETRHEFGKKNLAHQENVFSCPHCHVSFDNTKAIRVHAFKKHGILLDDQELEEWRTGDDTNKNTVSDRSPEQLRYKCQRCSGKFRTTKAIRIHTFKRHGFILSKKELARCKSWISKSILSGQPINRNRGKDLVDEPNPCDRCGRVFGNYRALFTHYRQAHRIESEISSPLPKKPSRMELTLKLADDVKDEIIDDPSDSLSFTANSIVINSIDCPKCDRTYTQHKSLVAHLYSAHKIAKDQYPSYWPNGMPVLPRESKNCPTCNKECVDDRAMRIHMFKAHGTHYRDLEKIAQLEEEESESSESTEQNFEEEEPSFDDNELSVIEEIKGPPVCFICGRLFKSRRALMTHEYKFHGIRWVGRKRIFPQQVRNLPKMNKVVQPSSRKFNIGNGETVVSKGTPKLDIAFSCPECDVSYHNRRAITTHLCRIHKYKRDDIHAFFDEPVAVQQINTSENKDLTLDDNSNSDNLVIVDTSDTEEAVLLNGVSNDKENKMEVSDNDSISDKDDISSLSNQNDIDSAKNVESTESVVVEAK